MKIYQNIKLDGVYLNEECKDSKFYNKGKWSNFIEPLLPKDPKEMIFVEFGSNAGLYLKLAKEYGFNRVVGVDKSKSICNLAKRYQDGEVINVSVDEHFNFDLIPAADVVLMANFHYHVGITDFLLFLDRLRFKTRYVILVSSDIIVRKWLAAGDEETIKKYFKEWKFIKYIPSPPLEGDPCLRRTFSFLFESDLKRVEMNKIFYQRKNQKPRLLVDNEAENYLARALVEDKNLDFRNTLYYRQVKEEKGEIKAALLASGVLNNMRDVIKNGIRNPIIIDKNMRIWDGSHRFKVMNALGYKTIIVRIL